MQARATAATPILALAIAFAPSLHAASLPGFTVAAQTDNFTYYTRDGLDVDVKKNERTLADVETLLGQKVQGRGEFYRYGRPEQLAATTGQLASGLTQLAAGRIHSTESSHPHEIVHWVAGQIGDPGDFFQEGLAVALTSDGKWRGRRLQDVARHALASSDFEDMVRRFKRFDPEASYPVAGAFVAWLIDQHGVEKVVEVFRRTGRRGRTPDFAFARVFGQTLDQAGKAWAVTLS